MTLWQKWDGFVLLYVLFLYPFNDVQQAGEVVRVAALSKVH